MRILFVDDELNVLAGLRDSLRRHRREWDMVFAPGGPEALAELRQKTFDVIVSDMRMPAMDGAALLEQVRAEFPEVARIILSGHAERNAVLRALPVAQQFLSKPCDAHVLEGVLKRIYAIQNLLPNPAHRR